MIKKLDFSVSSNTFLTLNCQRWGIRIDRRYVNK